MSGTDLFDEILFLSSKKATGVICTEQMTSKQPLCAKCDANFSQEDRTNEEFSRPIGNWCEVLSSSLINVNPKQAWRSGTEKLAQTLNNVRNTFGVLSQRMKKSTKKRQLLINMESPRPPVTPYTRSKAVLGRTPTKLYSPFSIVTPTGKENKSNRPENDENHSICTDMRAGKKRLRSTGLNLGDADGEMSSNIGEAVLSKDLLQAQIGIYEFQSVAQKIAQNEFNN